MSENAPTLYILTMHCGHTIEKDLRDVPLHNRANTAQWISRNKDCDACNQKANQQLLLERQYQKALQNQIFLSLANMAGEGEEHMRATVIRDRIMFQALEHHKGKITPDEFADKFTQPASHCNAPAFWINNADVSPEHLEELLTSAQKDPNAHIAFTDEELFG